MIPERIDGYLSRTAQRIDPKALVVVTELPPGTPVSSSEAMSIFAPEVWVLRRPGHPDMRLGTRTPTSFGDALDALRAWVAAQKAIRFVSADVPPGEAIITNGTAAVRIVGLATEEQS